MIFNLIYFLKSMHFRLTSVLAVGTRPAFPADTLHLTGRQEDTAVLTVAAGTADTLPAPPAPPLVAVVAQRAGLAGVAGIAGRTAALLRTGHERAAGQLGHSNVQHHFPEIGLGGGGGYGGPYQHRLQI
jgi:hypothetical protein